MNNSPEFLLELSDAYDAKLQDIDKHLCSSLKENFQLFLANFRAIYDLFIQKGILKEDPYKNERHLSDIHAPEDPVLNDSEMDTQLPILLSEYDNIMDFLVNYTPISAENLNLKRIKILTSIVKYIDWSHLVVTNNKTMTRGTAALAEKIRLGNDSMASGSLQSAHNKMDQLTKEIMKQLKNLADFKREEYKLLIRQRIISPQNVFNSISSKEDFTRQVKSHFSRALNGEAFYPELVQELFSELYEQTEEELRNTLMPLFAVDEKKKKQGSSGPKFNLRDILMDGLRNLGTASRHLDEGILKLIENNETLKSRPKSFMQRFKLWIVSLSSSGKQTEFLEIELVDLNTSVKRLEKLEFISFCSNVQRKARYLTSLLVKTSSNYVKLETAQDDQIYELLERNLSELKSFYDYMDALDTYFKSEAQPSERNRLKGIKVELGNIKNSISLVNQKMHEFIAKRDELEQLKKLGISMD